MTDEQQMEQIDNKRLIARLDNALSELEEDLSLIATVAPERASEVTAFREQVKADYSDANRRIILGDEDGSADLEKLVESISERRINFLQASLSTVTSNLRNTVSSPLWFFGDHTSTLEQLDEIQERTRSILQDPEKDKSVRADELRQCLSDALDLIKRVDREKNRAQFRIPLQIVIWGIPIILGFTASRQFTGWQILTFTALLVVAAIITSFSLRRWRLGQPALFGRLGLQGVLKYVTPRSSSTLVMTLVSIMSLLFLSWLLSGMFLPNHFATKPLQFHVGSIPDTVSPGQTVKVPVSVSYSSAEVIFDVEVTADAPGLIVTNQPISYPAVGSQEQTGELFLIVPDSIPEGKYPVELSCSFRYRTENRWWNLLFPLSSDDRVKATQSLTVMVQK